MNKTIVMMTLRQIWSRKVRILLVVVFMAIPLLMDLMFRQANQTEVLTDENCKICVPLLALTLSAGIIGQDITDGILPSIFSRPIQRWTYVFSKWLTASSLVMVPALISLGCHFLFVVLVTHNPAVHVFEAISRELLMAFGTTSVVLLLSSVLPGAADVGVVLLLCVFNMALDFLGYVCKVPGMNVTANNIYSILFPFFDYDHIRSWQSLFSYEVGRYVAIVFICLSVSMLLVNQKELSYGSS